MKLQPKVYIIDVKLEETKTLNFSHPEQVVVGHANDLVVLVPK